MADDFRSSGSPGPSLLLASLALPAKPMVPFSDEAPPAVNGSLAKKSASGDRLSTRRPTRSDMYSSCPGPATANSLTVPKPRLSDNGTYGTSSMNANRFRSWPPVEATKEVMRRSRSARLLMAPTGSQTNAGDDLAEDESERQKMMAFLDSVRSERSHLSHHSYTSKDGFPKRVSTITADGAETFFHSMNGSGTDQTNGKDVHLVATSSKAAILLSSAKSPPPPPPTPPATSFSPSSSSSASPRQITLPHAASRSALASALLARAASLPLLAAEGVKSRLQGTGQGRGILSHRGWFRGASSFFQIGGDDSAPSPRSAPSRPVMLRRNSQSSFADPKQTVIVFDWDDTLFPTTYLLDDLRLNHKQPIAQQKLEHGLTQEILDGVAISLAALESRVLELLKHALTRGHVVLVTLARHPWVDQSCRCFYPAVGYLIKEEAINVVYAQEEVQQDYNKRNMAADEEVEAFYTALKGKAIGRQVRAAYSQYEGQSWKNVLSVGDSDFERRGTVLMAQEYMREHGLTVEEALNGLPAHTPDTWGARAATARGARLEEVNGQAFKLRVKTFKMLEYPTINELIEEIDLLLQWLPKMVALDDGFDADLSAVDDGEVLQTIDQVLSGLLPYTPRSSASPRLHIGTA